MVIRINTARALKTLKETTTDLARLEAVSIVEFTKATVGFAEFFLLQAQTRVPVKTGLLRASGTVADPVFEGKKITVFVGFNTPYAAIQNFGGEIFPVKAKALFIPLRPGVVPIADKTQRKASGQKFGVDFVLAKSVIINGNDYWTDTVEEQRPRASREIGRTAMKAIKQRMMAV